MVSSILYSVQLYCGIACGALHICNTNKAESQLVQTEENPTMKLRFEYACTSRIPTKLRVEGRLRKVGVLKRPVPTTLPNFNNVLDALHPQTSIHFKISTSTYNPRVHHKFQQFCHDSYVEQGFNVGVWFGF